MKTKQVTAQLFQAARRMTVEPGQYVMVVADMAIGVYTGDDAIPVHAEVLREPTHRAKLPTAKAKAPTGAVAWKKPGRLMTNETMLDMRRKIVAALQEHRTLSSKSLATVLGTSVDTRSWQYRDTLVWLRANGWVTAEGSGRGIVYSVGPNMPQSSEKAA